jgi:hypothetical protein
MASSGRELWFASKEPTPATNRIDERDQQQYRRNRSKAIGHGDREEDQAHRDRDHAESEKTQGLTSHALKMSGASGAQTK